MSFAGCAVVISHDRYFLDRIVLTFLPLKEIQTHTGLKVLTQIRREQKEEAWRYRSKRIKYRLHSSIC